MKTILRTLLIISCLVHNITTLALSQDPIILFSDLISAPSTGWSNAEPNKGAVITIWGRHFGATRGSSYITVNGVQLQSDSDYLEDWGQYNNPVPFLQTITFQLNSSVSTGNSTISVTVNDVTSNTIPFRINNSSIFFVDDVNGTGSGTMTDPWGKSGIDNMVDAMTPGDVVYFRDGIYDDAYNGGKSPIWVRSSEPAGTLQDPIAYVGYPNEDAYMDGITNGDVSNFNKGIKIDARQYTIAKFRVAALGNGISVGRNGRIIGNDVVGATQFVAGVGIIQTGSDGVKIYANTVHGARSLDRLDHSIYISGCQEIEGADIAYNYSYDNYFDRGPHFVDNHQGNRCASDVYMKSNYWHHNVIACGEDETATGGVDNRSRGIGIYDLSWDVGEANEPEPAYVYNNILIGCGKEWHGAMYHNNGHAKFFNNTLVNSRGKGIQVTGGLSLTTEIKNNVIIQETGISDNYVDFTQGSSTPDVGNNSYFGGSSSPYSGDSNPITSDPQITVDLSSAFPLTIASSSPLIDAGTSSVSSIVIDDFNSTIRLGSFEIGAVEFSSTLSINDESLNNSFLLMPNPTNNTFTFEAKNDVLHKLVIYNQVGQLIKETTLNKVNVSDLSNGTYIIKFYMESGKTISKKLIKY
ncbi:MAG: T9SS type A sorting domain-containing protein [Flavobacteriaceae bacterium]|nr:T9SS type A sorting domain-containing protein [Flavobacteriaceae bacterium]